MPVLLPSWTNVELFVKMNKVEVKKKSFMVVSEYWGCIP
jgi:hypothetical protein